MYTQKELETKYELVHDVSCMFQGYNDEEGQSECKTCDGKFLNPNFIRTEIAATQHIGQREPVLNDKFLHGTRGL